MIRFSTLAITALTLLVADNQIAVAQRVRIREAPVPQLRRSRPIRQSTPIIRRGVIRQVIPPPNQQTGTPNVVAPSSIRTKQVQPPTRTKVQLSVPVRQQSVGPRPRSYPGTKQIFVPSKLSPADRNQTTSPPQQETSVPSPPATNASTGSSTKPNQPSILPTQVEDNLLDLTGSSSQGSPVQADESSLWLWTLLPLLLLPVGWVLWKRRQSDRNGAVIDSVDFAASEQRARLALADKSNNQAADVVRQEVQQEAEEETTYDSSERVEAGVPTEEAIVATVQPSVQPGVQPGVQADEATEEVTPLDHEKQAVQPETSKARPEPQTEDQTVETPDKSANEDVALDEPKFDQNATSRNATDATTQNATTKDATSSYQPTKQSNLSRIRGIGPDAASRLSEAGILDYQTLASTRPQRLDEILVGAQSQSAGVGTWPQQAWFVVRNDWEGLATWQSLNQHLFQLNNASRDDLTRIGGIGPATAQVLHSKGITSYEQVAAMDSLQLRALFNSAGPQYQLIDPATWPAQADLANRNEWDKLRELNLSVEESLLKTTNSMFAGINEQQASEQHGELANNASGSEPEAASASREQSTSSADATAR